MKKSIAILLGIVFVVGMVGAGLGGYFLGGFKGKNSKDQTFDKPEACILYFFEQLQKGDMEKVLSVFSTEHTGANFDFEGYNERMGVVYFGMLPPKDEFFQKLNQFDAKGRAISQLKGLMISLMLDNGLEDYPMIKIDSNDEIEDIAEEFDFSRIQNIEVKEICKVKLDNDRAIENYENIAKNLGHEYIEEYLVSFKFEHETYVLGISLYEDKGKFSIYGLGAMLMNTSSIGFASPMKEDTLTDLYSEDTDIYTLEMIYER